MYGDDRRINYLLQKRPNPLMTATVLMQQAEINIITKGNALIYIQRDTYGVPVYFWLAMLGGYNPETDTYALTYQTDRGVRALFDVPSSDVLHIPNTFRDYGGYTGIPPLTYAAQALNLAATQDSEAMANAAKGGKMTIRLAAEKTGLAVYGPRFGRMPFGPHLAE
jgi:phage portal protein BeeE